MSVLKFIARSALASTFINGGIGEYRNADHMAAVVDGAKEKLPGSLRGLADSADSTLLVKIDGAVMTAAAASLALGIKPRCAAAILAAQMIPVTAVGHPFWEAEGEARTGQRIHFFKNLSMAGGLLLIALGGAGRKTD